MNRIGSGSYAIEVVVQTSLSIMMAECLLLEQRKTQQDNIVVGPGTAKQSQPWPVRGADKGGWASLPMR